MLSSMRQSADGLKVELSGKLLRLMATDVLEKQLALQGLDRASLDDDEAEQHVAGLLQQAAAHNWEGSHKTESLLKRARHRAAKSVARLTSTSLSEEAAGALLARVKTSCVVFKDLTPSEMAQLSKEVDMLDFRASETILHEGEPASFFGVVLTGSVAPMIMGQLKTEYELTEGELVGEMALFSGGTRGASVVATSDGLLAIFRFSELERLGDASMGDDTSLATKIFRSLALFVVAKQAEQQGMAVDELTVDDVEAQIGRLLAKKAEHRWATAEHVHESYISRGIKSSALARRAKGMGANLKRQMQVLLPLPLPLL